MFAREIERVLQREVINTRRFAEPGFLPTLLAESAKVPSVKDWHIAALSPLDGDEVTAATPTSQPRPAEIWRPPLAGKMKLRRFFWNAPIETRPTPRAK